MHEIYEIVPDRSWSKKNSIEAVHPVMLPGMHCPVCGPWATTGLIYPNVNVHPILESDQSAWSKKVSPEEFKALSQALEIKFGLADKLGPGAELGPLSGAGIGTFGDYCWANPWTPLLRQSVYLAAQEEGIILTGVPADIRLPDGIESLVELEAIPMAKMVDCGTFEKCAVCGRRAVKRTDPLVINHAEFDSSVPLQRLLDLPTVLVGNSAFSKFIRDRDLQDVKLLPLTLH